MSTHTIVENWRHLGMHTISSKINANLEINENAQNHLKTFKASTTFPIGLPRVAFVLEDIASRKKWINRINEHYSFNVDKEALSFKSYEHYKMMWPIQDREYVLQSQWEVLDKKYLPTVTFSTKSIQSPQFPLRNDRVRGELYLLQYTLVQVTPNKTNITVEIQVDPKGKMPKLFVNMIQRNWPINTLKSIYLLASEDGEIHRGLIDKMR
ncbi:START domain-containing protein [Flammeovirga agarivorans]|uniref:START domain-containing protein n=1 Tax=Flammeovirga agarivorans TaxID=2726742 RepID=A0A7X8SN53_9BACT|nr:START domain-containing protein [Flammeovirga agarivorans]NLR93291.1 hypothetical protein [Flammeovirga agarivorans]